MGDMQQLGKKIHVLQISTASGKFLVHAHRVAQREIICNPTVLVNNMEQRWLYHQK